MAIVADPSAEVSSINVSKSDAELYGMKAANSYAFQYGDYGTMIMEKGVPYFAGRVISSKSEVVQVMSDEWATQLYVTVANYDGTTTRIGVSFGDKIVVDVAPALLALVNERANGLESARKAVEAAAKHLDYVTPRLGRGCKAKVVKGRKVKIGSEVEVFWLGTVNNKFSGRREERAGIKVNGETVWVAAQNLEPIPTEKQVIEVASAKAELAAALKSEVKVCARWNVASPSFEIA